MSVVTRKRFVFLAFGLLLAATALFADDPSARSQARMVYVPTRTHIILFGGETAIDRGINQALDLNDTWEWTGDRWAQRYPATVPPGRSAQAMVWDSTRNRILMFGGKKGTDEVDDTWSFDGNDWTELGPSNSPSKRYLTSAAYDSAHDRVVLFGGEQQVINLTNPALNTITKLFDTWEFDGTNWRQTNANGPQVTDPSVVYDAARDQVLMLGVDDKEKPLMYAYDRAAGSWQQLNPATMPTCATDSQMTFKADTSTVLLFGGTCTTDTGVIGDTWEWDGSNWTKDAPAISPDRLSGQAQAFDAGRQAVLIYGGAVIGAPKSTTWSFTAGKWTEIQDVTPPPRSLFGMATDAVNNVTWLWGGLNENGFFDDFWQYQGGVWTTGPLTNGPSACQYPLGAFDTNRSKFVVVCEDSSVYEWDGSGWGKPTLPSTKPPLHQFASLTYDPVQKKVVLFGGFDTANYLDETWTWDGATWTRQKKNPPPARGLASMWFDPTTQKLLLFGGIGRRSVEDRIERFSDMWSYDPTNGWTEMKNLATPGARYGAETAVDPRTGNLLLFGGLRLNVNGLSQSQVYADDTWQWDGKTWTKITTASTPPGRENGRLFFDPSTNQMTLFGGYNGRWLADVWTFDGANWTVRAEDATPPPPPTPPRRRAIRH